MNGSIISAVNDDLYNETMETQNNNYQSITFKSVI